MSEPDYSILIGADGSEGLENLIKMIRFDTQVQVYMVIVEIVNETFDVKASKDNDLRHKYNLWRKVSLREGNNIQWTEIFYSPEIDRYYMSVARIAHLVKRSTEHMLKNNINGKYANYFFERCDGRLALVKGLSK